VFLPLFVVVARRRGHVTTQYVISRACRPPTSSSSVHGGSLLRFLAAKSPGKLHAAAADAAAARVWRSSSSFRVS